MTLWQSRLGKSSDVLKHLNDSLHIDIRLFPYDAQLNTAWAEELKEVGILIPEELEEIKKGLALLAEEYQKGAYVILPNDEDVHSLIERRLTEEVGDAGRKIHTGKSRNDQVVTDLKLYLKDLTKELNNKLADMIKLIVKMAEKNIDTIMPGYTHGQQAQPISLAHYLLSLAFTLKEDRARLKKYSETNLSTCPLGSGALAGTTLNIDRARLAKKLGFDGPTENSIQSTSDRAFVIELASILAIITMHLSRYAEDFTIWNSKEFSFIELSDAVSTGSSMMPQKKNPDSLEYIRATTGTTYGNLTGLLTITKGVPLCYAKDLQDDKKFIFESIDTTLSALDLFIEVLQGITFNKTRLSKMVNRETLTTDLTDILVERGVPFRKAYEEVATLVRKSIETRKSISEFSSKDLQGFAKNITPEDIVSLSLESSVERRSATGGTSTASIKNQIEELNKSNN